jgi:ceramide glucosyltransferase
MLAVWLVELGLGTATAIGAVAWLGAIWGALRFQVQANRASRSGGARPPVTLLKPVYGLEKNLYRNLRTACEQDYPEYQVVYSVQRADDPALPLLRELEREFGSARATVVVGDVQVGMNGKINNLAGALPHARYDILVISDSDVRLRPDYLQAIVAPLRDPKVGGVSTFFKGAESGPWYEQMEMLTLNVDHFGMALFAGLIGIDDFCFGASFAFRHETLRLIGGLSGLANYLVEDNEMGQRIVKAGLRLVTVPYLIDTTIDLRSPGQWWQKMTYWDQNTRAARPLTFGATIVLRIVPLSLLFAAVRGFDAVGLSVLVAATLVRILAGAVVLGVALRDYHGLLSLWMIPLKDILSLFWFVRAFVKRTVVWRGTELALTRDGRFVPPPSES